MLPINYQEESVRSTNSRQLCCLLLTVLLSGMFSQGQTPGTPAPGVDTGQKIGTIIKTAISTAAPGVSSILDLIWSHLSNPSSDKAKKTDLQKAATNQSTTDSIKQKTVANAQVQLQPISKLSDELAVINRFLAPSVTATQNLIVIRTKMVEQTTDWQTIQNQFDLAKVQINNLKSVSDTDLDKVRDAYLRMKLSQIRGSNDTTVISINQEITQHNLDGLKADLPVLLSTLADMTAVAGYEIAELQSDISDLAAWAKGTGAGSPSTPDQEAYTKFLNAQVLNK